MFTNLTDARVTSTIKELRFFLVNGPAAVTNTWTLTFAIDCSTSICRRRALLPLFPKDGGNTFPLDRNNPLSCIGGGDDQEGANDDRQWAAAFGDGIAYSTVRNAAVAVGSGNFHVSRD
jgi:hypothetical protein